MVEELTAITSTAIGAGIPRRIVKFVTPCATRSSPPAVTVLGLRIGYLMVVPSRHRNHLLRRGMGKAVRRASRKIQTLARRSRSRSSNIIVDMLYPAHQLY